MDFDVNGFSYDEKQILSILFQCELANLRTDELVIGIG